MLVLVFGGVPGSDVDNRYGAAELGGGGGGGKCERSSERRDSNNSWSARWYFTAFSRLEKHGTRQA